MLRRILAYIVPFILIAIEEALRSVGKLDSQAFVGPTFASAAIGLMLPLTQRHLGKRDPAIPDALYDEAAKYNAPIQTPKARTYEDFCFIVLFAAIGIWTWTLYLSVKHPDGYTGPLPTYDYLGAVNYLIAMAMTEIRERI